MIVTASGWVAVEREREKEMSGISSADYRTPPEWLSDFEKPETDDMYGETVIAWRMVIKNGQRCYEVMVRCGSGYSYVMECDKNGEQVDFVAGGCTWNNYRGAR